MTNREKRFYDFKSIPIPYEDIDVELRPLIKEMNKIDGICTTSCCIGHGINLAEIDFIVRDLATLYHFICNCLNGFTAFDLCISLTDPTASSMLRFYLRSKSLNLEYNKMICNNLLYACIEYNKKTNNNVTKNKYRTVWKEAE